MRGTETLYMWIKNGNIYLSRNDRECIGLWYKSDGALTLGNKISTKCRLVIEGMNATYLMMSRNETLRTFGSYLNKSCTLNCKVEGNNYIYKEVSLKILRGFYGKATAA
jgi:hypothetical protein